MDLCLPGHILLPAARWLRSEDTVIFFTAARIPPCRLRPSSLLWFLSKISRCVVYMGRDRVELSTPALSERCSNQLSYHPARHHAAGRQDIPHHATLAHEPFCSTLCFFFLFPEKEVIQPHLPVRLPCYDFTPLTSSRTFRYDYLVTTSPPLPVIP